MSSYRDNAKPSEAQVWVEETLARIEKENSVYVKTLEQEILNRIYNHMSSRRSLDQEIEFPFFIEAYCGRRTYEREELATNKAIKNLNQIGWSITRFDKADKRSLRVNIIMTDSRD